MDHDRHDEKDATVPGADGTPNTPLPALDTAGADGAASLPEPSTGPAPDGFVLDETPAFTPPRVSRPTSSTTIMAPQQPRGATEDTHDPINLHDPELFLNRELSWIGFNERVLAQALDEQTPLLERLKFLCISSSNLDEFFEVRVGRLHEEVHLKSTKTGPDGMSPAEQLAHISRITHDFVSEQYRILNDVLIPELDAKGIRFLRRSTWDDRLAAWVREYFEREVHPVLSPLGLDPAHPFPRVLNKSLNFIVSLEGQDAFGRDSGVAVVQAPRSLPRIIQVPPEHTDGEHDFIFLSSIIHAHVGALFVGMNVRGCYQFRVTRNSELFVDEEEVEDLLHAMEEELYSRHYGSGVRLEVADNCPIEVARYLLDEFELTESELYQVNGPVNLNRLMAIPGMVQRPDLKYDPFVSATLTGPSRHPVNLFEVLQGQDVLLHHPFESFSTVIDFFKQAAADPKVLAIKQTLYRTESDSVLVSALVDAARAGKEVTAVIELRARFDEERNIAIASRLQDAGAHVVYGVVGYKTHAKMTLIVRREEDGLRRYVHLGTGNYHPRTTKLYTDYGLLSSRPELGVDVHRMFQQLTGLGRVLSLNKLLQAPFTLYDATIEMIEREIEHARAGRRAHIMGKMNSLTEPGVIRALYRASRAGVKIDLIIRGVCRLRPGVPGVSDRITVRSIVGRFLEHTRVYYFHNGGDSEVYCSSADWMSRNLHRRVEASFPIEDPELARRVVHESFDLYLRDDRSAWDLQQDGSYTPPARDAGSGFNVQEVLLDEMAEDS